jgi:DNA processing protein
VALVDRAAVVVSGFAVGIDQAAHQAAVDAGGRTVLVLCHGFDAFRPAPWLAAAEREGRALVLSQFAPGQAFSRGAAMARNRVVAALAHSVVMIESRRRGGAMETVRMARELLRPVFTPRREPFAATPSGNRLLLAEGMASALAVGDETGAACLEVAALLRSAQPSAGSEQTSLPLFD